jgi:hypothetical protein
MAGLWQVKTQLTGSIHLPFHLPSITIVICDSLVYLEAKYKPRIG